VIAHILPCMVEAEILAAVVWAVAHARDLLVMLAAWWQAVRS